MATQVQLDALKRCYEAAKKANHIFPGAAACEAALESTWFTSILARIDNNLFGMKQHVHPEYATAILPTREFEHGEWVPTTAEWVKYPDWAACMTDRMATLVRLSKILKDGKQVFEHYIAALAARTPQEYILEVSKGWSTDPGPPPELVPGLGRANKVLAIYMAHAHLFDPAPAMPGQGKE